MSVEATPTPKSPFFHPLAVELGGTFSYDVATHGTDALAARSLGDDPRYRNALNKSVETMVVASQHAEINHLTSFGLTDTIHGMYEKGHDRLTQAMQNADDPAGALLEAARFEISKFTIAARFAGNVAVLPSLEAMDNYVGKVTQEETVGEGMLWLAEKAFSSYSSHAAKAGSKGVLAEKSPFEACGVMNNGRLGSTDRLDRVIAALPDLLSDAGASLSYVHIYDRNDPTTNIRHRVWPVELTPQDTVSFYADKKITDYITLRRRRPVVDAMLKFIDQSANEQFMLLEGYKESFAQVMPRKLEGQHRVNFENAFSGSTVTELLSKKSRVADVCGDVFGKAIDERDETTPAVVPTYTCLMFRFTDPFIRPASPVSPIPYHN
jgi:hypothetical protein